MYNEYLISKIACMMPTGFSCCYNILIFFFPENVTGFKELWLVGDNFMATTYRENFLKDKGSWFMKDEFEISPYCSSRFSSSNTNVLSRIQNSFIRAMNEKVKLPDVIVILIDRDVMNSIEIVAKSQVAMSLFGTWVEWLADDIAAAIKERWKQLPGKACKEFQPVVYWSVILTSVHFDFETRSLIAKFNNALDSVIKLKPNMRLIKFKNHWNTEDSTLVANSYSLSGDGIHNYWRSLDASVKFNWKKELLSCISRESRSGQATITRQMRRNVPHWMKMLCTNSSKDRGMKTSRTDQMTISTGPMKSGGVKTQEM